MSDDIKIGLSVDDTSGSVQKRTAEAKALKDELDRVTKSAQEATSALKQAAAAHSASSTFAMGGSRAGKSSAADAEDGEGTGYRRARGVSQATGAGARDFAREAQGLGGLVHLYATFAANIFAVGAAYTMLDRAFSVSRMEKATDMLSSKFGVNLKQVSNNLVEATGHAISFQEAIQFTNMGTAAGLTGKQIENLTVIAKGAANALGRDMGDSVRRIVQGTAKQEQEILDELGIFVKAKDAYATYAKKIGTTANELSATEKVNAYAEAVALSGEKWKEFAAIEDPFSKFMSTSKETGNAILKNIAEPLSKVLGVLADSKGAVEALMILMGTKLVSMAVPHIGDKLKNAFAVDPTEVAAFNKSREANLKSIDRDILTQSKALNTAEDAYDSTGSLQQNISVKGFNAKRLSSRLNADVGDIARIDPTDKTKIEEAVRKSILSSIKTEDQLQDAINNKLVKKSSVLGAVEVNATTVNKITKETLTYTEATTKAYQAQVLEQEKLKALEGHRMSISEEQHKRADINNPNRAFNKDLVTEKLNLINQDLGSGGIGAGEKLGNTFRNLGAMVSEAKGNFTSLGGIALKTGATIQMVGVAGTLAIRGILAALGPLMLLWTAWELVGKSLISTLGFFGKEAEVAANKTALLADNNVILTTAMLGLNKAEQDSTMTKQGLAKYSNAYAQALSGQVDSTREAILASQEEEKALQDKSIVYHATNTLLGQLSRGYSSFVESIKSLSTELLSLWDSLGNGITSAFSGLVSWLDGVLSRMGKFGEIIRTIAGAVADVVANTGKGDQPKQPAESGVDKLTRESMVRDTGATQLRNLTTSTKDIQAVIDAKETSKELRASATLAKSQVESNIKLVQSTLDEVVKGNSGANSRDILKLAGVGQTVALGLLEKAKKESADIARKREKDTQDPTEMNAKQAAIEDKLAQQKLANATKDVSQAEKLQGYASESLINAKASAEVRVADTVLAKEKLRISKDGGDLAGKELGLAQEINAEKKQEIALAKTLGLVQAVNQKAQQEYRQVASFYKTQGLESKLGLAQGTQTTESDIQLANNAKLTQLIHARLTAEEAIIKASASSSKIGFTLLQQSLKEAELAVTDFEVQKKTEEVLRNQVSSRNTLNNQSYLYSEYMKKAIEEGATLADFTSTEVTGESLVLDKMKQQLVTLNTLSGTEKVSGAEKLRLETDLALKDAQKLERKKTLRNLEQEIDKIGIGKLTKERLAPVLADESFARFEDFRNKMRGVITGTFDAVYKGMDSAIDSLTTKMMKNQKFNARDILRDFGNAAAEEFRQMAADRMKLQFRSTITNMLGGPDRDKALGDARAESIKNAGLDVKGILAAEAGKSAGNKVAEDIAKKGGDVTTEASRAAIEASTKNARDIVSALPDSQIANKFLEQIAINTAATAATNSSISDKTLDPTKAALPSVIATEAAKAKAVSKAVSSEFVGLPAPTATPAAGWTDAGSTRNMVGNSLIGGISGLLMAQVAGSNNKLAPWISAIGGGLLSGLMGQKGGIMGMFGGGANVVPHANGGIMSSLGSVPLNKYANGGVASTPQLALFGEGRMNEAFVPLPDGRTIPVSMKSPMGGGVNNVSSQSNQVTVHVNPTTGTTSTNASGMDPNMMQQLGSSIGAKVREELMFQKRPGGLLY